MMNCADFDNTVISIFDEKPPNKIAIIFSFLFGKNVLLHLDTFLAILIIFPGRSPDDRPGLPRSGGQQQVTI